MKPTHFNRRAFVKTAVASNAAAVARTTRPQPTQQQQVAGASPAATSPKPWHSPRDSEQHG
jgi:hypothetical protein